jgi:hypothetical protein
MVLPRPLTVEPAAVTMPPTLLRTAPVGVSGAGAGVGLGDGEGEGEGEGDGEGDGEGEGVGVDPPLLFEPPPFEPPSELPMSPEPELAQPPKTNRLAMVAARHLIFLFMMDLPF